ncbi:OFA family MFS transporter [Streptomyces sp. NPDC052036]|uniref:OFA family MFS transporter n=1 Tax=Streptomyces sp. NPDC052036 TaxID=3155171 RepID=UPI0034422BD2
MTSTDLPTSVPYREVTDRNGRVYRIGESDIGIMGRSRIWMIVLPWVGMTAIGAAAYALASAQDTFHAAQLWRDGHIYRLLAVWVFFQAAVAFPAGRLRESGRLPARTAMAAGACAMLLGSLAAAFAPHSTVGLLGFGVCGGIGAGLVHATCVTMAGKWYPERRGAGTGFVSGGSAYGSVPFVFLFTSVLDPRGHTVALTALGVGLCLVVAAVGCFFEDPPRNWWPAHRAPVPGAVLRPDRGDPVPGTRDARIRRALERNPPAVRQYSPKEAARSPVLWLMWLCLPGAALIDVFGIAFPVPFGADMGFAGGVVATAMSLTAIVSGTASGVIGWISDRCGRRTTLVVVCVVLGTAQFGVLVSGQAGSVPFFLVCSMVSGVAGGAVLPLIAAMTADFFGENHSATHYGMVYSSNLISGLVACGLGAVVVGEWDYPGAFVLAGSIGLASAVLALFLKAPGRPNARRIVPNPHPLGEEMA